MEQEWVETLVDRLRAFLESNYDVEVLDFIMFGSVVTGDIRPGESDLDVVAVVEGDESESPLMMAESAKEQVSVEGTPVVGVDAVVTPEAGVDRVEEMFEHTEPYEG